MPICVQAVGAITPVGDDARLTMASIWAGVQHFDDLDVRGPAGAPVTGGRVPLTEAATGARRLGLLALLAARECVQAVRPPPGQRVPLVLCLPEPIDLGGTADQVFAVLDEDAGLPFDPGARLALTQGRVGTLAALGLASQSFAQGHPACVVLAADSLTGAPRIARLRRRGRLAHEGRGDGFVPSEGAVALWLTPAESPTTLAVIAAHAVEPEPRIPDSDMPVTGVGLSRAIQRVAAGSESAAVSALVHDASGPLAWSEELALVQARPPLATQPPRPMGPALSTGELGAASSALSLAVAAFLIAEREIPGNVLMTVSGEGAHRGAALVVPPTSQLRR